MGILDFLFSPQQQADPAAQPAAQPAGDNRLLTGLTGFLGNLHNGPIGALAGGIGALATGQRTDPSGIAQQRQAILQNIINGPGDQATKLTALTNALIARGDVDAAAKLYAIANGNVTDKIKNFNYGVTHPEFAESLKKDDAPTYGLNPVLATDENGNPAALQLSNKGGAQPLKLPNGYTLTKPAIKVDSGTETTLVNPITNKPVATFSKNIPEATRQEVEAKAQAEAGIAFPQVKAASEQMLKTISQLENHPGMEYSLGAYSKLPTIPGTEQANFRAVAGQLKGQTFLQAYQMLRGGGAITDVEGQKGENAIARLDQAQSVPAFKAALKDLREVVSAGVLRAQAKARMSPGVATAPIAVPETADPLGIR